VPRLRSAFTIIELIVVVTVIIVILAIAVPGLSAMNAEARLTAAQQVINGALTQAYHLAWANRSLAALRLLPAEWDVQPDNAAAGRTGRQSLAIYSYVGTNVQENTSGGGFTIGPKEYFQRAKEFNSALMPEDVWAAPLEALSVDSVNLTSSTTPGFGFAYSPFGSSFVLDGQIGWFAFDANRLDNDTESGTFLNADDFLLVCDAQTGLRTATPTPYLLRANVPADHAAQWGPEPSPDLQHGPAYQRYSFSGVVTYRREPFAQLGTAATGIQRQTLLRESGRAFLAHRYGGGLVPGLQRPQ
jgi:type II secretory pathway pseudopilin PulG